jgi:hypothetical protein
MGSAVSGNVTFASLRLLLQQQFLQAAAKTYTIPTKPVYNYRNKKLSSLFDLVIFTCIA